MKIIYHLIGNIYGNISLDIGDVRYYICHMPFIKCINKKAVKKNFRV